MATRKRYFPYTVTIDGQAIPLSIKRLTVPEFEEFQAKFVAMGQGRGSPILSEATSVTADQVDAQVAYLKANAEWLQSVFDRYVTVASGQVFDEDEQGHRVEVTNGGQFADMYAGYDELSTVLLQVWLENKLTMDQKKKLQSRSDSANGSTAASAAPGERPAPIVESADREGSAVHAAVMAPSSETSSGTTAPLSSEPVPCAT